MTRSPNYGESATPNIIITADRDRGHAINNKKNSVRVTWGPALSETKTKGGGQGEPNPEGN